MKTDQNRAKVLAQFLRAARQDVLDSVDYMLPDRFERYANAIDSIRTVAEELEAIAAAPDVSVEGLLEWVMEHTDAGERVGDRRTVHWLDGDGHYQETNASSYTDAIRNAIRECAQIDAELDAPIEPPDPAEVSRGA